MSYVKQGEKVNMIIEMIPIIEIQTGKVIDWQISRCFRVNVPKQKSKSIAEEGELVSKKHDQRLL